MEYGFILHIEASKDVLFVIFLLVLTGQFYRIWKKTENVTKDREWVKELGSVWSDF